MLETVSEINKAWNWIGINAVEIIQTNDFGNIIFKTQQDDYFRICPEELSCEKIANSKSSLMKVLEDSEFIEDWQMKNLVLIANSKLGKLKALERYYLVIPAVIGGTYSAENIQKISFSELISLSGNLAYQIKDIEDGQKIKLNTTNIPKGFN